MRKVKELMVGFDCYFRSTNKIERVSLAMITWNADRPENQRDPDLGVFSEEYIDNLDCPP